jgi:transcriptional regulator with XRE-family HTH domain
MEKRLADALRDRRLTAGLSLRELASLSGVSKAMITKIEGGRSSPTAGLLGRLCAGLNITLSSLMRTVEEPPSTTFRATDQPSWQDPESGLVRTLVAPALHETRVEIARVRLPGGAMIPYDIVPIHGIRQHIVMLSGNLKLTRGSDVIDLGAGDCLFTVVDRPTRFETPEAEAAEYLVIQEAM